MARQLQFAGTAKRGRPRTRTIEVIRAQGREKARRLRDRRAARLKALEGLVADAEKLLMAKPKEMGAKWSERRDSWLKRKAENG